MLAGGRVGGPDERLQGHRGARVGHAGGPAQRLREVDDDLVAVELAGRARGRPPAPSRRSRGRSAGCRAPPARPPGGRCPDPVDGVPLAEEARAGGGVADVVDRHRRRTPGSGRVEACSDGGPVGGLARRRLAGCPAGAGRTTPPRRARARRGGRGEGGGIQRRSSRTPGARARISSKEPRGCTSDTASCSSVAAEWSSVVVGHEPSRAWAERRGAGPLRPGGVALHRALADPEGVRGVALGEVEVVAQHDDLPLPAGQRGQRVEHVLPPGGVQRGVVGARARPRGLGVRAHHLQVAQGGAGAVDHRLPDVRREVVRRARGRPAGAAGRPRRRSPARRPRPGRGRRAAGTRAAPAGRGARRRPPPAGRRRGRRQRWAPPRTVGGTGCWSR